MKIQNFIFLFLALLLASSVHGQRRCLGSLRGPRVITSDVHVPRGVCRLINVRISGTVTVTKGASLVTGGNVTISGGLRIMGAKEVRLDGFLHVLGGLSVSDTPLVRVGPGSNVGIVSLSNVGRFEANGAMTSVSAMGGGPIILRGAKVLGGGVRRIGKTPQKNSDVVVCGGVLAGGITMTMVSGSILAVGSATCAPSEISGTIMVDKGEGDVKIVNNVMRAADVIISEQIGNVFLQDVVASDVAVSRVTGSISFKRMKANSDSTITFNSGSVTMIDSALGGDMQITSNQDVTILRNDLANEMLNINMNRNVVVRGNTGFSGVITENQGVTFSNNQARGVTIGKNGKTKISGNSFGLGGLHCADNSPAPTGSGNTFNRLAVRTGQCGRF